MLAGMIVLPILLLVATLAVGALGMLMASARLPRNGWVGVRTEHTVNNPDRFNLANKVAAPTVLAGAAILLITAVAGFAVREHAAMLIAASAVGLLVAFVLAGIGASYGARAVAVLASADPADSCGVSGGCGTCSLAAACAPAH